ncbi:hypothetical protein LEQ06_06620 [Paraclostridium sp. AKS46]|nr:hypothetical protein [Paraclostridium sp. AKS46]
MITSNTQMRSEEEIASAKNTISEFKDIKFFVMNDSTGVSYSNTKYRDNEEFRKNQKGYVNLEIDFSNNMNRYTKIIDNKRSSYRVNRDLFWGVPKDNLTISMSFPKESSNDGYNSILFDGNYSSFEYYKNLSNKLNKVLIASAISSIISLILLIKNKEKLINKEGLILKLYAKIPLEIYTFIFITSVFLSVSQSLWIWWSTIFKFIFLSFTFIWISYFINLDDKSELIKNSITYRFGKFFINVITNTINYGKKIPLIKRLILLDLLILMCTTFILMFFNIQFYSSISFRVFVFILTLLSSVLFIVTGYTINRLAYIDEIIEGTEKIKNGDINHKIKLRDNNSLTILAENINNLSDGLENAIEETLKSERMKTELITNVSHDLKTPLTSIINYVDLIKKKKMYNLST